MKKLRAYYYDGQNSGRREVEVHFFDSGDVHIQGENLALRYRFADMRLDPRVGNMARHLHLPGGAQLETADNDTLDAVARTFDHGIVQRLVHTLESSWGVALAALVLTAIMLWAGIEYGVPVAAAWAAAGIPEAARTKIGAESLHSLDNIWLTRSTLDPRLRQRLDLRFRRLAETLPGSRGYRLAFRDSSKLGANAIALPDGTVVITDALVKLAGNDEQIVAVLAHEIGHLQHDHGLRSILQNSLTAIIVAVTLGDVTSISSLAVMLPTLLVEARYSRQFEWEADAYALELLKSQAIPALRFAEMLERMQASHRDDGDADYFSSHPGTQERIARIHGQEP